MTMKSVGSSATGQLPLALTRLARSGDENGLTLLEGGSFHQRVIAMDAAVLEGPGPSPEQALRLPV